MELDWELFECEVRSAVVRIARQVVADHPQHSFYGLALEASASDGSEQAQGDAERLEVPVLALNSEEALARDKREESGEVRAYDAEVLSEHTDDAEADIALAEDVDGDFEDGNTYYSRRWDPSTWHWCSMDLFDDDHAQAWNERLAAAVHILGWAEASRLYYRVLVRVVVGAREELDKRRIHLVAFVADGEQADELLRQTLTPQQLRQYFPDLDPLPLDWEYEVLDA